MTARLEDGPTTAETTRGRGLARWWVVVAVVLVGVLVAASGTAALARDNRRLAETAAVGAAAGRATEAVRDLATVVPAARAVLARSADRVADEGVRTDLAAALDAALSAARVHGATVEELDAATARVVSSRDALRTATSATAAAVSSWEIARAQADWSAACAHLDETLAAARGVLDASAGRVADDAVRQALASAVDSAQPLVVGVAPADVSALSAAVAAADAAAESIAGLQAAVTAAVASWTQAQAAAARATAPPKASGAHSSATKPPVGASGVIAPQAAPPTSDGHWETTVTYEDLRICGDTGGNSWEC
jgi:hypothetical protein